MDGHRLGVDSGGAAAGLGPEYLGQALTERRNRLRNLPMIHYGLGTMYFNVHRLMTGGRAPLTLVGHAGGTGTWLFHCPELDVHLAGTIDQSKGAAIPFRYLAGFLNAWRSI